MRKRLEWKWESLYDERETYRAKVIGGWILLDHKSRTMCFVSDKEHEWVIIEPQPIEIPKKEFVSTDWHTEAMLL